MNKTFFIADTHFGHKNIIDYEKRPYKNANQMNVDLINKWNSTVSKHDTIFLLGDVSFMSRAETKEIIQKLNGKKQLVLGNHDGRGVSFYLDCGFETVSKYPIIFQDFLMLSHEPMYINKNMPYANIFGHVHGSPAYKDFSKQTFCVSVERIGYKPISLDEILNLMDSAAPEIQQDT